MNNFYNKFKQYQTIWDDCYLGYVIIPNQFENSEYTVIIKNLLLNNTFEFYPWLDEEETIHLTKDSLHEIDTETAKQNFIKMTLEAIHYGSHYKLSENKLIKLFDAFLNEFSQPKYFCNFNGGVSPVTNHTLSYFLCVIDKKQIGMWLSVNDE